MLTKEQRDEILRLAAELIKAPSDTWGSFGRLVKFTKYIDSITAPDGWQMVPVEPTREMLSATSWPSCAATDYRHMLAAAPRRETAMSNDQPPQERT